MSNEKSVVQKDSLNRFNTEFVETLNDLKVKKKKITKKINKERDELNKIIENLKLLENDKKNKEDSLKKKEKTLKIINTTLNNTQSAYNKILEASHCLLTVIKKDKIKMKGDN
tara:strand:- start:1781 stop:2119 length:339 start_codon:yes stop_codon:yes gene_type:complete